MILESPDEILEWNTQKLWNAVQIIKEEIGQEPKGYKQAKDGIKLIFPIQYIIQEWYETYPSNRKAKILGYGKARMTDFLEEIEQREAILRNIIQQNTNNENPTQPRTKK